MENTHVENNMSCDSVSDGFNYNGKRGYCLQLSTLFLQERLTAHCRVGTACSLVLAELYHINHHRLGLTLISEEALNWRRIVNHGSQTGFSNTSDSCP